MPTRVMTTAAEWGQSAIDVDSTPQTSPVDMWIGSRVRIKRTSRGMSQQEFCKLLGIGWNDLCAFEAGAKRINANLLFRVAKSLDVGPDYFFRGYVEEQRRRFSWFFWRGVKDTKEA
jgi:transcriptional regulator with XRE-family HTH domain